MIKIDKIIFREVLKKRGLNQKELAKLIPMNVDTLSRKINNKRDQYGYQASLDISELEMICKILNVAPETLEGKTKQYGLFSYFTHEYIKAKREGRDIWNDFIEALIIMNCPSPDYFTEAEKKDLTIEMNGVFMRHLQ